MIPLRLDAAKLTEALAAEAARAFSSTIVLSGRAVQAASSKDWTQALDLIVKLRIRYEPNAEQEKNGLLFYSNLALFSIGGPFCYWIPDRNYSYRVELEAQIFDAGLLTSERMDGSEGGGCEALLATIRTEALNSALDFRDRARGPGSYLLSLVWPSGFLAAESEQASTALAEQITSSLATQTIDQCLLPALREDLLVGRSCGVPFWVADWSVRASGDSWVFQGSVDLIVDWAQSMAPASLTCNGRAIAEVQFDHERASLGTSAGRNVLRIPMVARFDASEVGDTLRLHLTDSGGAGLTRSFTIPLASRPKKDSGKWHLLHAFESPLRDYFEATTPDGRGATLDSDGQTKP